MKRIILIADFLCLGLCSYAQSWMPQAKKAVFSVITYDKDGKILNTGNGFFIDDKGTALSDYKLFKNADKAVIVDADGKKNEVNCILGANDLYDVIKFHVTTNNKTTALKVATAKASTGAMAYILPYSTQKGQAPLKGTISSVATVAEDNAFYTIGLNVGDKNVSCPLMNESGQVIGLVQKGNDKECYGMSALYASQLSVTAFSNTDYILNSIGIRKALPTDADQALVALMMAQTANTTSYPEMLESFIKQFPDNAEGYFRRATFEVEQKQFDKAEEDLKQYADKNADKADVHYNLSKLYYQKNLYQPEPSYSDWNFNKALTEIQHAVEINKLPIYVNHQGDVLFAMGNYAEAYRCFESISQSEMRSAAIFYSMSQCLQNQSTPYEQVVALQDSAVNMYTKPYSADAAPYIYARALYKAKNDRFREAIADYNEVEHIYGGRASAEFYYNRHLSEVKCRMYQQALDDIEEAASLAPDDFDIVAEQTSMYVRINDLEKATTTAQILIRLNATSPLGYRLLGYCQANTKQKSEALKNLNKAKELGDENADAIIKKYCK